MNLNLARKLHFRAAPQAFEQNVALDLELMFVAGVLVMASATRPKIGTGRRDSMRRCLYDRFGLRSRECRLLLDNRSVYLFAREHKRKKDGLTRTTGIRWQVSQSVAAINQLFNREEQKLILRHRTLNRGEGMLSDSLQDHDFIRLQCKGAIQMFLP